MANRAHANATMRPGAVSGHSRMLLTYLILIEIQSAFFQTYYWDLLGHLHASTSR